MKFFVGIDSLENLKAEYRRLVKKFHPDCGGDTATMQQINDEYSSMFEMLKKQYNASRPTEKQTTECPEDFINIVSALLNLDGLEIELCGQWLWIGGNTKPHKEELKKAGCRWSKNKNMWYWRHEENKSWRRGTATISEIRAKYGSQVFQGTREIFKGIEPTKA